jgi:TolB-like protein
VLLAGGVLLAGCHRNRQEDDRAGMLRSPYAEPRSLAVTVFLNQSGSDALDPIAVTDEFYTELQQVEGLQVIPVNRVLAALQELGLANVRSPAEAVQLAEVLGVDGVIVGSITRYDPYPPPLVGMAIQLYAREDRLGPPPALPAEAWELARLGKPFELAEAAPLRPRAMVVRIFDADQPAVQERLKQYARARGGDQGPYGWKRYTTRQNYLGFVAQEMIGELLAQESQRLAAQPKDR